MGSGMAVVLKDQDTSNYYNVILNGKVIDKIHPDTTELTYLIDW